MPYIMRETRRRVYSVFVGIHGCVADPGALEVELEYKYADREQKMS